MKKNDLQYRKKGFLDGLVKIKKPSISTLILMKRDAQSKMTRHTSRSLETISDLTLRRAFGLFWQIFGLKLRQRYDFPRLEPKNRLKGYSEIVS